VSIEYRWEHSHENGTVSELKKTMLPRPVKHWIEGCIDMDMDWRAVKKLICVDKGILNAISNGKLEEIPEALWVAQKDVYNAFRRRLVQNARLDPDGYKSLELWKARLKGLGYTVYFEKVSAQATGKNHHVFALVSPWQKTVSCKASFHLQKY
jgi:hypothetical protein